MKKRIKTRRLTNIYHSDDDDVGDGYNLAIPLSLSLSLGPSPSSQDSYQQSAVKNVPRFLSTELVLLLLLLVTTKSVFL